MELRIKNVVDIVPVPITPYQSIFRFENTDNSQNLQHPILYLVSIRLPYTCLDKGHERAGNFASKNPTAMSEFPRFGLIF